MHIGNASKLRSRTGEKRVFVFQWSLGVLMWEVFTLAATPFPEVQNADMRKHIRTGVRLQKPEDTPVAVYASAQFD